jgi:hypothetical protein
MTNEQKPSQSESAESKSLPTRVHLGEKTIGNMVKCGEVYTVPETEVRIPYSDDKNRYGIRRNASSAKTLIRTVTTEGPNDYLITRGTMIDLRKSVAEKRLMLSDIWGSENVRHNSGINLTIGRQCKVGAIPIGEVTGVLVQTGDYEPVDSVTPEWPDTISIVEARLKEVVPDYQANLEAAIEHFDDKQRSVGHIALE